MYWRVALIFSVIALMVVAGCGKAPEVERQNAEAAIEAARTAEAEDYAGEAYQQAVDTLNAAMESSKEQEGKFFLFRSYGKSKELFVAAKALAEKAATDAEAEKSRMRSEVMDLMSQAEALIAAAEKSLATAPRGKGSKADIELIKGELAAAKSGFEAAKADFDAGKYMAAKAKLESVMTKAQSVSSEIEKARARKSGR